ncbi:hypothetical protein F4777DRAFT_585232 [Nemania sp. FL0916]|nr:hypothetical protein F4777DRAFT_585232 [Nemania sp. FL0916]
MPASTAAVSSLAVKAELNDSSPAQPKLPAGEIREQPTRQAEKVGNYTSNSPLATARLSRQCQLRGFNPKWYETAGPEGFKCSVQLIDKMIRGEHVYPTAYEAKQAVAEKALVHVHRLPRANSTQNRTERMRTPEQTGRHTDRSRQRRTQIEREPTANAGQAGFHRPFTYTAPAGATVAAYNWDVLNPIQGDLGRGIQSIFSGAGPSSPVLSDPLLAQAFLQGLTVGASVRAASSAYDPYLEPQGPDLPPVLNTTHRRYGIRDRSPTRDSSRHYRDRSSPRRSSPRRRTPHDTGSRRSQ